MQKIRFGVIGYGYIAKKAFLPAIKISKSAEIVAISSRDTGLEELISKEHNCDYEPNYESLLKRNDIDAVYIPELKINIKAESQRLKKRMDEKDSVNVFLSEGAGIESIVSELESSGQQVLRDSFGHLRLDEINSGQWFAKQFTEKLGAEKTLVQKSGYFARSAAPNDRDLDLIRDTAKLAAQCGLDGESGVVGMDQDSSDKLGLIAFDRIKGGKPFDTSVQWFVDMLNEIGQ